MKIRFENFKSFKDTGWFEIPDVTILLGANGTGKSSYVQPLLLLRQTLAKIHNDTGLAPNGYYVKAGNYKDFIYQHDKELPLKISLDFDLNCKSCEKGCKEREKVKNVEDTKVGDIPPSRYELIYHCDSNLLPDLFRINFFDCLNRKLLVREKMKDGQFSFDFLSKLIKTDTITKNAILNHKPNKFLFDDSDVLKEVFGYSAASKPKSASTIELSSPTRTYLSIISFVEKTVTAFLEQIKYIGPARETPKRVYEYNKEFFEEVGKMGENTASIIFQNKQSKGKMDELKYWLDFFEFASDIRIQTIEDHPELFSLEFKPKHSDFYVNYSDSCFGLSQLLPIIVQAIFARKADLIITEQPELHLNPLLAVKLAGFVSSMAKKGRKFLVETHSEHFFLRLRTNIKQNEISSKKVGIYFFENQNGLNSVRKIEIGSKGEFQNNDWPKGFFEQSLAENLMFATAMRKK